MDPLTPLLAGQASVFTPPRRGSPEGEDVVSLIDNLKMVLCYQRFVYVLKLLFWTSMLRYMKIVLAMFVVAGLFGASAAPAAEPTLAEKLCSSYTQVESVSCRVRKTSEVDGKTATLLSQVYYQRPDRMHVENIAPIQRRIIADGRQFYYYVEGMAKGFSCPLTKLEGEWSIMQKSVPGSAMEHLLRLDRKSTRLNSSHAN